jgi:hypothetical protein
MDYKEFEEQEQELFIDKFYPYEHSSLILTNLKQEDYNDVREKTLEGIRSGIEKYLVQNGNEASVYLSDLGKFVFDSSVKDCIEEKLEATGLENISLYAEEVCDTYRMFIYNESSEKFLVQFGEN